MRLGPYTLDPDHIAAGAQARIFSASDPDTGEVVAVKAVSSTRNVIVHKGKLRRLSREANALIDLRGVNELPVLVCDTAHGWFSMPLADASLRHLVDAGRVPWQTLRAGLQQVAETIQAAHAMGLVHRDLHPGNVLVFPRRWCVADWGFVYNDRAERQTRQMTAFGLPFFVAPEILKDPSVVRPSADIFAIGRIAEQAAALGPDRGADGPAAAWVRALIDGAGAYDERLRWTMADVLAHLRTPLPMSRPVGLPKQTGRTADDCPNCGSPQGFDPNSRCLRCHAVAY